MKKKHDLDEKEKKEGWPSLSNGNPDPERGDGVDDVDDSSSVNFFP